MDSRPQPGTRVTVMTGASDKKEIVQGYVTKLVGSVSFEVKLPNGKYDLYVTDGLM
jgi:hypothetical protein